VPAHVDPSTSQRIYEAHALLLGEGAVGGWAAAHWQGSPFMDGLAPDGTLLPVLLLVGKESHRHRQQGIDISRDKLPATDITVVGDVRCTSPLRTAFDLARRAHSKTAAVVAIDTLLECALIDRDELRAYVDAHRGWRGVPRARAAVALSTYGVRSPGESRLRMGWLAAGLPPVLVNPLVFSVDGYLIGIPDLLSVESSTVVEYDGEDHLDPEHQELDRRRDARFAIHGLSTVRVTRDDMNGSWDLLMDRLRRAYADGRSQEPSYERWTLDVPPGWDGDLGDEH
jgi:hypothetical protein